MQTAAVAEILRGGDVLLASHTGSGKTLAYLLPLVHSSSLQSYFFLRAFSSYYLTRSWRWMYCVVGTLI